MTQHKSPAPPERSTRRSKRRRVVVAFQGELGSFSEQAVVARWNGDAVPLPQREYRHVLDAVERLTADFGVLPVSNTIAGEIADHVRAIAERTSVRQEGSITIPVHQCLVGVRGATVKDLRTVASHPAALAQCSRFFAAHPRLTPVEAYDTAGAARDVAARGSRAEAAIASPAAAERYGLDVLVDGVSDEPNNLTTFAVITVDQQSTRAAPTPHRRSPSGATVQAIRGATTVGADAAAEICDATVELLQQIASRNQLDVGRVISVFFTVTPDLRAEFPARAARELGWEDVAMLCASSIPVPGSVPRCIRALVHVQTTASRDELQHVYLRGARMLRPDLVLD